MTLGRPDPAVTNDEPPPDPAGGFEHAVIDYLYDGVYYVDRGRRIRYWNQGAERLTGYPAAAVVGHFCNDNLLKHVDATGKQLCRSGCPLLATMVDGEPREAQVFLSHREGHRVPVRVRTTPVRDREGKVIGGVEIFDDSTELSTARREVSELRDLAMHDALTGLPNRRHYEMSVSSRIAELAGYGRRFGLLIADIDRFKLVNDQHGHATGDVALRTVARTLLESSRAGDDIARFGGEEFALTITDVDERGLRAVGDRFRALVEQTRVRTDELELAVTISLGGPSPGSATPPRRSSSVPTRRSTAPRRPAGTASGSRAMRRPPPAEGGAARPYAVAGPAPRAPGSGTDLVSDVHHAGKCRPRAVRCPQDGHLTVIEVESTHEPVPPSPGRAAERPPGGHLAEADGIGLHRLEAARATMPSESRGSARPGAPRGRQPRAARCSRCRR